MVLLDDIATKLTDDGIAGGSTGFVVFKSVMPDDQDKAVAIFETAGDPPDAEHTGGVTAHEYPGFQIRVRGAAEYGTEDARQKAKDVFAALHNANIAGFVFVVASSSVLFLGHDEKNRPEFAVNFDSMREQ